MGGPSEKISSTPDLIFISIQPFIHIRADGSLTFNAIYHQLPSSDFEPLPLPVLTKRNAFLFSEIIVATRHLFHEGLCWIMRRRFSGARALQSEGLVPIGPCDCDIVRSVPEGRPPAVHS